MKKSYGTANNLTVCQFQIQNSSLVQVYIDYNHSFKPKSATFYQNNRFNDIFIHLADALNINYATLIFLDER